MILDAGSWILDLGMLEVGGKKSQNSLAGSLKKYAREYAPLNKVRKKITGKIADEIASESISD